ncbi:MAG TPA: ribonuclease Z [Thermoanaerobaculia bacterium]|nr:ribonuclease Z [Thermoanaerobaculia bacterium]
MQSLTITFLGTSSGTPSRTRNVSSVAMTLDGTVLLFDCGEGTQHRLLEAPVRSGAIEAIFITHLHGDHVYGIPGLLATLSMNGRTRPLDLIGPPELSVYLESTLRTSFHNPSFEIRLHDVKGIYRGETFTITALELDHSIPSFGYCLVEDDHPGKFDPDKARALGYEPGPVYTELIRARDPRVLGAARPGRRIAYCTDTRPCAAAVELARGADVLIHESTYAGDMRTEADERKHSTAAGAARIAAEAGVGRLILTHFSSRYRDVIPLLEEARAIFPNTDAAEDLMTIEVTR